MYDSITFTIASRMREARMRLGYTQIQLGELADVSAQYVAELEKGRKNMSVYTFAKLARALNVSADYLLWGKEYTHVSMLEAQVAAVPEAHITDAVELMRVFLRAVQRR